MSLSDFWTNRSNRARYNKVKKNGFAGIQKKNAAQSRFLMQKPVSVVIYASWSRKITFLYFSRTQISRSPNTVQERISPMQTVIALKAKEVGRP